MLRPLPVPLASHEACPIRLGASGGGLVASVRPNSSSKSDSFLLLRVARGLRLAVELGRTWCVRHGHLRFARLFQAAAAEQQCTIGMLVRGGKHHHKPNYGTVSVCIEGTAQSGGWIRRRKRRVTERRRAGKRRVELSLNELFCYSDQYRKL